MKKQIEEEMKNIKASVETEEGEVETEDVKIEEKISEEEKEPLKSSWIPNKESIVKGLKFAGVILLAFGAGAAALACIGARSDAGSLLEDKEEKEDKIEEV